MTPATLYRNALYCVAICLMLSGCSGLKVKKSEVDSIRVGFSETFQNIPFFSNTRQQPPSLLKMFNIIGDSTEKVHIQIMDETHLRVNYINSNLQRPMEQILDGKLSDKGYFEIYFRKYTFFVPVLYYARSLDRVRIATHSNGALIVDNKWVDGSTTLMLFNAGGGERHHSFYRRQ